MNKGGAHHVPETDGSEVQELEEPGLSVFTLEPLVPFADGEEVEVDWICMCTGL